MTGGMLGFLLFAILIPLVVNEAGDLVPSVARRLLRWGARRIGHTGQAERYEEEWLADLERVPGKLTKLIHASGVLIWSVPRLRAQFRQRPSRRRLSGVLPRRMMNRIGKQLAGTQEIAVTLQHIAERLVPQFADHCFIDLFQGDVLIRRVQRNTGDWTPPPGTWAQVGEQIRFPDGHFCQQAMAQLDTVLVTDLAEKDIPAPSAQSAATSQEVGLTSIITAPLCARGVLLGVIAVALSGLTDRAGRRYTSTDRDFITTVASQVATAIDDAMPSMGEHQTALTSPNPQPRHLRYALRALRPLG
jgi:GAF domain